MNLKELIQENLNIDSTRIYYDEPMTKHTSFKIGGKADCLIKADTIEEVQEICQFAKTNNIQLTIIGNGSNLLVQDGGIRGIVIKINIKKYEIEEENNKVTLTVGA